MTTEEINIAIEEECWWKIGSPLIDPIPDYCTDLNEMREVEKTLTIENFARYEHELCKAVDTSGADSDIWFYVLTATAHQRAEAFLRTKGKWKE